MMGAEYNRCCVLAEMILPDGGIDTQLGKTVVKCLYGFAPGFCENESIRPDIDDLHCAHRLERL